MTDLMTAAELREMDLPPWSQIGSKRGAHIERVVNQLRAWAAAMRLSPDETREWIDAGRLHDALRDAPEDELRTITGDRESPAGMLHGPAAAKVLEREGEKRKGLLDAVRYHTIGHPSWANTGKALYMADYLEPGRKYLMEDRHFLAAQVPLNFEGVFGQLVRIRLEWAVREGNFLYPETVALWNSIR